MQLNSKYAVIKEKYIVTKNNVFTSILALLAKTLLVFIFCSSSKK